MNHGTTLKSVQTFKKDAKKHLTGLKKNKELRKYITKLSAKKRSLERSVKKAIQSDIRKANKFLQTQQKGLDNFHKQIKISVKRKIKHNSTSRH